MSSEQINEPVSGFNEPRRLFNQDLADIDLQRKPVLRRFVDRTRKPDLTGDPRISGRVQRQLGVGEADFKGTEVEQTSVGEIEREVFTGGYSLVRSARTLHQYDVDFWSKNGVVGYATRSEAPPPSSSEVDEKYNDFLAFSYVPDSMLPSAAEFSNMVNPQAREAFVLNTMASAGVITNNQAVVPQVAEEAGGPETPSVAAVPFAENLQSACAGKEYFMRSTGPLYTSQRQLA